MEEFFPPGIVTGPNFCNRVAERRELAERIRSGAHTWLMSPRRYGKTSLIHQVAEDLSKGGRPFPHARADMLRSHDAESFNAIILEAVGSLVSQLSTAQTVLKSTAHFLKRLQAQVGMSESGPSVSFAIRDPQPQDVTAALLDLDALAGKRRRRCLLALDEFQVLGDYADHGPMEAGIRHAVEQAKHLTYLFSGSNRRLLAQIFEEPDRPLFRLCERLGLPRIARSDLRQFLVAQATRKWGGGLDDAIVERLLDLTDGHPYFVGILCRRLWRGRQPALAAVETTWHRYVQEEESVYTHNLQKLAASQRGILLAVARRPTRHLLGKAFLRELRLTPGSAKKASDRLKNGDYIYHDPDADAWKVLDPGMGRYLRNM